MIGLSSTCKGWEFFSPPVQTSFGSIRPLTKGVPGALSLGVKRPGREADHSPPSNAEFKNVWNYTSTPQYAFMARCSIKAQGQLYLYLYTDKPRKITNNSEQPTFKSLFATRTSQIRNRGATHYFVKPFISNGQHLIKIDGRCLRTKY
jgi:hypothetical protein